MTLNEYEIVEYTFVKVDEKLEFVIHDFFLDEIVQWKQLFSSVVHLLVCQESFLYHKVDKQDEYNEVAIGIQHVFLFVMNYNKQLLNIFHTNHKYK